MLQDDRGILGKGWVMHGDEGAGSGMWTGRRCGDVAAGACHGVAGTKSEQERSRTEVVPQVEQPHL
ncbi:hypothetical protein E2C01_021895 [Portunus trituberculatus]|uniref:Uncharacterized protein n=1 Tax=Portunus trituberculatus TaxID=210409 RepID=A0A5B7E5U2_PORTR|nr:hypothetical protein [Portunus trituberculatus]